MATNETISLDGREISLSNLSKVYFPSTGFLKSQVIEYYSRISATLLPHLAQRPLTLKRYPDGVSKSHFYEKNAPSHTPPWVKRFGVPRSEGGSDIQYLLCNDLPTLIWVTNLGDIEKHVLLAKAPVLNRPTSIVFDLDPGEGADILDCAEIALKLREIFSGLGLESFAKVSGSKGLHLNVPLNTNISYEVVQPFAKAIAELAAKQMPDRVVSEMAKTLRRGKILIDWSQNSDFKTTVSVYAMRAKDDGPFISLPVTWEELRKAKKRDDLYFTPKDAVQRVKRLGDLFAPVLRLAQKIPAGFSRALAKAPPQKLSRWPRNTKGVKDKSLREYAAKRDHSQTPEPTAKSETRKGSKKGPQRFVIQKHQASHLHYDWRLEMQGVLRSWAVPKGPPTEPREARLAMHVEDHPLDYADFEGTIPPGNYGAGTVMVWDQGTYEDLTGNAAAAFHAGKMHVVLQGKKLKGEWILVKDRRDEAGNRWLLIKAGTPIKLSKKAEDSSAVTGRSMAQIAKQNDRQWKSNRPEKKLGSVRSKTRIRPHFVAPMLCQSVTELPKEGEWTYELKFDGYRCIATKENDSVTLYSRNEKKFNTRFPLLVKALSQISGNFTLDGEIVAIVDGKPSFQHLQNQESKQVPTCLYAFDILNRDGESLESHTLEDRRSVLESVLSDASDPLRLSPLLAASADQVLNAVGKLGLEGVIAKRNGSTYESGERSGAWCKCRTSHSQDFVIGGFVPGAKGFDALIVGLYKGRALHFVAQVRAGFVPRVRDDIAKLFPKLESKDCPFVDLPETKKARWGQGLTKEKMKSCRWLNPKLVCECSFVEWTDGDRLRHPAFLMLRKDKKAKDTKRET